MREESLSLYLQLRDYWQVLAAGGGTVTILGIGGYWWVVYVLVGDPTLLYIKEALIYLSKLKINK